MKAEPTPGPWIALPEECDKPYIRIRGTIPGGRYKVANVLTPTYEGVHEREANETRLNAKLIASAPELRDALKLAVEALEWARGGEPLTSVEHEAILKGNELLKRIGAK